MQDEDEEVEESKDDEDDDAPHFGSSAKPSGATHNSNARRDDINESLNQIFNKLEGSSQHHQRKATAPIEDELDIAMSQP
jgi:hypothetical protein